MSLRSSQHARPAAADQPDGDEYAAAANAAGAADALRAPEHAAAAVALPPGPALQLTSK